MVSIFGGKYEKKILSLLVINYGHFYTPGAVLADSQAVAETVLKKYSSRGNKHFWIC